MTHANYFEIEADSYYELGRRQGTLFRSQVQASVKWLQKEVKRGWSGLVARGKPYLEHSAERFPLLVEEARGYAEGADVAFEDYWVVLIEDELSRERHEKCTGIVTNGGLLLGHNEDWEASAQNYLCVLRKTIVDFTIFELNYITTLGGNSVSFNSHGFAQSINALTHADSQQGVPRNVIARWLSQTGSPDRDYERLQTLQRSAGYHHTLLSSKGELWSIECSAKRQVLTRPEIPFVHTNHYLTELDVLEHDDGSVGSIPRYEFATKNVKPKMTVGELKRLMKDTSLGKRNSLFNQRTIGQMVLDLEAMTAHVWLKREAKKGWVEYSLK